VAFKLGKPSDPTRKAQPFLANGTPVLWGGHVTEPNSLGWGDHGETSGMIEETRRLWQPDPIYYTLASGDSYGWSADWSVGRAAVGAIGCNKVFIQRYKHNHDATEAGPTSQNEHWHTITSSNTNDYFGYSVSMQGRKLVVGAPNINNQPNEGGTWLFDDYTDDFADGTKIHTWTSTGNDQDAGYKVVFRQNRILSTAPGSNRARLFDQDGTLIKQIAGNRVDGTYTLTDFGRDAAIGCGVIAITGVFSTGSSGHLEVFDLNGNLLWRKKDTSGSNTGWGWHVTIAGGYIFVAAPFAGGRTGSWLAGSSNQGMIYKYDLEGNLIEYFNGCGVNDTLAQKAIYQSGEASEGSVPSSPRMGYRGMEASGNRLIISGSGSDVNTSQSIIQILDLDGNFIGRDAFGNGARQELLGFRNGVALFGTPIANSNKGTFEVAYVGDYVTPYDMIDYQKGRR
jgi:hypothetical protein